MVRVRAGRLSELIRPVAPREGVPVAPVPEPVDGRAVLREASRSQRRFVALAGTFSAVHQAAETTVPILIGLVIDRAVARSDPYALAFGVGGLAVLFGVLTVAMRIGLRNAVRGMEGTGHGMRVLLTRRVLHPGGIDAPGTSTGDLLSVASTDAADVGLINAGAHRMLSAVGGLVVATVALMAVSPALGLFILLGLPPWLWFMGKLTGPVVRRTGEQRATAARASGQAADYLRGLRALAGIGAGAIAARRFRSISEDARKAAVRAAAARSVFDGANTTLTGVFLAVVALFAGILADRGDISVGQIVMAVGLASSLIAPLSIITGALRLRAAARVAAGRVAEVLGAGTVTAGGDAQPVRPVSGALYVAAEALAPGGGGAGAMDGGLDVRAGELVGVAAYDPADANRLVDLLARRVEPPPGALRLDGADVAGMELTAVRSVIGVAFHQADLFRGSLADNVLAGADPARLDAAMAAAAVDDVAEALPDGVRTTISERGLSLSGGQRQRVALARALAADAPVLVLHEPTTAVDAATEARVADGIRKIRRGRTTVLITTSPILLSVTDRVAVIRDHHVTETAPHADLITRDPTYRELVLR